jgi:hypothetical protein
MKNKTRTKSNGNAKSARKTAVLRGLVFSPQPSSFRVKPREPDMAEKPMPKIGARVWAERQERYSVSMPFLGFQYIQGWKTFTTLPNLLK